MSVKFDLWTFHELSKRPKILTLLTLVALVISEHCAFKHSLSVSLPMAIVTVTEVKTLSERLIVVHSITFTIETALYEKKFKKTLNQLILVRFIKNTISQSLLVTQWSIRFTSR